MPTRFRLPLVLSAALAMATIPGCGGGEASPPHEPEISPEAQELGSRLSKLINDSNVRFRALDYEYNEDLLAILDRFERFASGKEPGPAPRAMPNLEEPEEVEHLRETIRLWEARTGKHLRPSIDELKAEVAARKPDGPKFHPEFQRHFSAAFDDLIPIEVADIRERRNRYIHEKARAIFDEFREKAPDAVREQEAFLSKPPYNEPPSKPGPAKP